MSMATTPFLVNALMCNRQRRNGLRMSSNLFQCLSRNLDSIDIVRCVSTAGNGTNGNHRNRMHVYNPYSSIREELNNSNNSNGDSVTSIHGRISSASSSSSSSNVSPNRTSLVRISQISNSGTSSTPHGTSIMKAENSNSLSLGLGSIQTGVVIDTLAMLRRFMNAGMSEHQAEHAIGNIQEVLKAALDAYMVHFVSLEDFNRTILENDTKAEYELIAVKRENERLRNELEKLRAEMKHEVDKLMAGQRLELNLEKGRIRDELVTQDSRRNEVATRLDKEINNVRTLIEQTKNDIIKYSMGFLVSMTAVGLGLMRLLI